MNYDSGPNTDAFVQVYFGDIGVDSSIIREYFAGKGAVCPDNVCLHWQWPILPYQDADLRSPARCWVCIIPTIIQVQLVPLWIFNRRE